MVQQGMQLTKLWCTPEFERIHAGNAPCQQKLTIVHSRVGYWSQPSCLGGRQHIWVCTPNAPLLGALLQMKLSRFQGGRHTTPCRRSKTIQNINLHAATCRLSKYFSAKIVILKFEIARRGKSDDLHDRTSLSCGNRLDKFFAGKASTNASNKHACA